MSQEDGTRLIPDLGRERCQRTSGQPRERIFSLWPRVTRSAAHAEGYPCRQHAGVKKSGMASGTLSQLLKLPPGERAELAMALRDSRTDAERQGELALTAEQQAEMDRRPRRGQVWSGSRLYRLSNDRTN